MVLATAYSWDFDRPSADLLAQYQRFSVGIFQWVAKASGKGLKQTAVVSRVVGYTEEPERVFEKAMEICRQLNAEGARAARRPDWLQKQYSVPRPSGMVVERRSDDFTAAQVRSMRLKVMREKLIPAGFVVGEDATYIRQVDDQIHLINFQGSRYGHEFTVNLGFHYGFVPPLFQTSPRAPADFHLLDCLLVARIGQLLPENRDVWFEYGTDREALTQTLMRCAATCLKGLADVSARWRAPERFWKDRVGYQVGKWDVRDRLGLGYVALKIGRPDEARKILETWEADGSTRTAMFDLLSLQVGERTAGAGSGLKRAPLCDWVLPAS